MTKEDLWNLDVGEPSVLLPDGKIGLLTVYPRNKEDSVLCGIQVPGEEEHRWYHHDNIRRLSGSALAVIGIEEPIE